MKIRVIILIIAVLFLGIISSVFLMNRKKTIVLSAGSTSVADLLTQAKELEGKNEILEARDTYKKLVNEFPESRDVMNWQKKLEELNIKLLFSPIITQGSVVYEIKPGDTLNKISKEFRTTVDLIMKSNNINASKITPGRKIKIWTSPFSILVDKSQNTLILRANEEVVKTYIVSTGKNNSSPVGTFKIMNKLINPTWFKEGGAAVSPGSPENILGTRWLGFDLAGYGIHGTTEPQYLGKQVTQGCVRMANSDVEELYIIVPVGTEVIIVD